MRNILRAALIAAIALAVSHAPSRAADLGNLPNAYGSVVTRPDGVNVSIPSMLSANLTPMNNEVALVGDSITAANTNQTYYMVTANNASGAVTWTTTGLPNGIITTPGSGTLMFTMNPAPPAGTYPITITATDANGDSVTQSYNLTTTIQIGMTFTPVGAPVTVGSATMTLATNSMALQLSARGAGFWINTLTQNRAHFSVNNMFGISGDTTTGLLNRMGPILNANVGSYVLMIGTNDLGSLSLSQLEANLTNIVSQLASTGRVVIWSTILPRNLAQPSWTGSINGNTMTVTALGAGYIPIGTPVVGAAAGTVVTGYGTGNGFGNGTYTVSVPQTLSSTTLTGQNGILDELWAVNRWIKKQQGRWANVWVVDTGSLYGTMTAPTAAPITGATADKNYSYDGLHPIAPGAYAAFSGIANLLGQLYPPIDPGLPTDSISDLYSANNPTGNLLPNGVMTSSAGTGTVSGRATGTAPDGWTVTTADNGCPTCTYTLASSMTTMADGITPATQLVFGGTAQGGWATLGTLYYQWPNTTQFAAGDKLVARCRIEVAAGNQHVTVPVIQLNINTAAGNMLRLASGSIGTTMPGVGEAGPNAAYSGVISTPEPAVALNAPPTLISLDVYSYITNAASGPVSETIKIGACSVRKS